MLSRVADSLFWMSRNVERAENNTRLIAVKWISLLENFNPDLQEGQAWEEIVEISGYQDLYYEHFEEITSQSVIDFLTFSSLNPNSILNCVQISRENARAIREIIPQELWELINAFYWELKQSSVSCFKFDSLSDFLERVKDQSLRFQGIIEATMPRDETFLFLSMGKFLERAEKTARILDVYSHKAPGIGIRSNKSIVDYHHWWAVLQTVSGHEAFLKKHHPFIHGRKVVSYLVNDPFFPRSVRFCIERVMEAFMELENGCIQPYSRSLYDALHQLKTDLAVTPMDEVCANGLHHFLQDIQYRCNEIGRLITKTYYLGELPAL